MDGSTAVIGPPRRRGPFHGRWLWVGVVAAVVVGIALVAAIALTARTTTPSGSMAAIGDAAAGSDTAAATLSELIETGTALAASTTANQLADPAAYSQLMGALATARTVIAGTPTEIDAARNAISAAMDRVGRSLSAKALADAQSDLSAVIGTAVAVNAGAAGRVDDDSLRAELQSRVDAGWALLSASVPVDTVAQQTQAITDQTAAVLAARHMGFRESDGTWCASGDKSCIVLAWPSATLANGEQLELAGGQNAIDGSGCYATDEFRVGREKAGLVFCPAGESAPDGYRMARADEGDLERDRLWVSSGTRLSELRYRA